MPKTHPSEVTRLLVQAGGGDPQAAAKLLPLVYDELRRLAHQRMAHEPAGLTLQPTALVHEAYVRLVDAGDVGWRSRGHFFGAAAEAMRRILVERARRYGRQKHGGGRRRLDLDRLSLAGKSAFGGAPGARRSAGRRLDAEDKVAGDVVKLRFFAGLTIEQTAEALGLLTATVSRHWAFARTWLYQQIAEGQET